MFTQVDVARPSKQFVIGVHVHNGDTCTYKGRSEHGHGAGARASIASHMNTD